MFNKGKKSKLVRVEVWTFVLVLGTVVRELEIPLLLVEAGSHFVPHLFVLSLVIGSVALFKRSKSAAIVSFVISLWYGSMLLPFWWGGHEEEIPLGSRGTIKVAIINVHFNNSSFVEVGSLLESLEADVIVVNELTDSWRQALEKQLPSYPHLYDSSRDFFRTAIFAAESFSVGPMTTLFPGTGPLLHVTVLDDEGTTWHILSLHAYPPQLSYITRNKQLQNLASKVMNYSTPVVLLGDLNTSPWNSSFKSLERAGLKNSRHGHGILSTWPSQWGSFGVPIDHILVSQDVTTTTLNSFVVPGSDHKGLIAELVVSAR